MVVAATLILFGIMCLLGLFVLTPQVTEMFTGALSCDSLQASPFTFPQTQTTSSGQNPTDPIMLAVLQRTNEVRALHGKPPLAWSTRLENMCKQSPNNCKMVHDNNAAENLASAGGVAGVNMWYGEIKCWDAVNDRGKAGCTFYDGNGCVTGTCWGHVANLLSKGYRSLGCSQCGNVLRCKYA